MEEEWKNINGFEKYTVSNYGQIKRGDLVMKFFDNGLGYLVVRIRNEGHKRERFYVHRLVLETFQPKTQEKLEVNHIDHNKANNHLDNLEWVTHKDNLRKAVIALGKSAFCHH